MKVTFLGTGTSGGVPVINCDCDVCCSNDPKNKRLRCSVIVETSNMHILIDTSMDMRQQLLAWPVPKIDAILYTHAHADHIFGLDDIRRFNYLQNMRIPVYGDRQTVDRMKMTFNYAFENGNIEPGIPNLEAFIIEETFFIKDIKIQPVPLMHGAQEIFGYRIGNFAYCTDVNRIPVKSYDLLRNLDVLVLDALREKEHPSHFSLSEAIEEANKIAARRTYFTHMNHIIDYKKHQGFLPENAQFAYDGLTLEL